MPGGADGYKFVDPGDCEPSTEQLDLARELLQEIDLPFDSEANFDEGVHRVAAMITASELTLEDTTDGWRHAEDIDANNRRLIVLAEKLKDRVTITLHCLEDPAAQLLIDGHMGYAGNN